MPLVFSFFFE
jgi:hypothetical protein